MDSKIKMDFYIEKTLITPSGSFKPVHISKPIAPWYTNMSQAA
jgi:hypothetical protein